MSKRIDYKRVAPEAVKALGATKFYLDTTEISPRLRALLELRTSQINGCSYCVDLHSRESRAALAWAEASVAAAGQRSAGAG